MKAAHLILIACTVLLGACCSEERRVVEIDYEPFGPGTVDDLDLVGLDIYRDGGWDCFNDGAIRNAAGGVIGERWVCTKCE